MTEIRPKGILGPRLAPIITYVEAPCYRMRAEKLADENHALSETTLELRRLTEDQGRGCVQILTRQEQIS